VLERERPLQYLGGRLRRQWLWLRQDGVRQVVTDQLEPVRALPDAVRKWRWRRTAGVDAGTAVPLFVVGVQRSGTNMLVRALAAAPEVEMHSENDRRAFRRYQLRPDPVIAGIVARSRHRFVAFKPLCDSHRVDQLLDTLDVGSPGKAIWAYRSVDGRVRSAVKKFADVNRQVLARIAAGDGADLWQAQRLSPASLELIRSFHYDTMSPESAAALFWYVRNSLYFDLGLDRRDDIALSSYDWLTTEPEAAMRYLCDFLGLDYRDRLVSHINTGRPQAPLAIDGRVRELCDDLYDRLEAAART
jgi:hypothetical protein